jgi:fructokinase
MRRVFAIGQSVFDIMFNENQPFAAKVGGSMLNTCVSLGRLGLNVQFIGEFGNDFAGNITKNFLAENQVSTEYAYQFEDGQTTISLAFLQPNKDADYNFYRNMPQKRLDIEFPEVGENDIVLFGSFYIFDQAVEEKILPFLQNAKEKGAILIYDPNFRKPHYSQIERLKPKFVQYFNMADIVRGSDEDFMGIFGTGTFNGLVDVFPNKNCLLIRTASSHGVDVFNNGRVCHFPVPSIQPVSTIGAGDTFNAGIIYSLVKAGLKRLDMASISPGILQTLIGNATKFAAEVCMGHDNYLSVEFSATIKRAISF